LSISPLSRNTQALSFLLHLVPGNVSQMISTFDDDIGFVAGLPIGTRTMAHAFKEYGASVGANYTAYYNGKWGIGV
jgi:hypothetical protein